LQVVRRVYIDLMGRNSQVERRMSGGRDVSVGRELKGRVCVSGVRKIRDRVRRESLCDGKAECMIRFHSCNRAVYSTYRLGLMNTHMFQYFIVPHRFHPESSGMALE